MKKHFVTLFSLLGMLAVGCQKEEFADNVSAVEESQASFSLRYSLNGSSYYVSFQTEEDFNAFVEQLIALAREGYEVQMTDGRTLRAQSSKETVTYDAKTQADAEAWAEDKVKQGYTVTISYDHVNELYHCVATR